MKVVIQRVKKAQVEIDKGIISAINQGLLVFLAIKDNDAEEKIDWLVEKIINLRLFPDKKERLNLSIRDIKGEVLVVSQFTLYADCQKGRRPSFIKAAKPIKAKKFYDLFVERLRNRSGLLVKEGVFGAMMTVRLVNDGPVTIIIEK